MLDFPPKKFTKNDLKNNSLLVCLFVELDKPIKTFKSFYLQKNRLKLFMIALSDFRNRQTNEELYLRLFLWNFLEENPASVIYMNSGHSFKYQCKKRR